MSIKSYNNIQRTLKLYAKQMTETEKAFLNKLATGIINTKENPNSIAEVLHNEQYQADYGSLYEKHERLMNLTIPPSIKRYVELTNKVNSGGVVPLTPDECIQLGLNEKLTTMAIVRGNLETLKTSLNTLLDITIKPFPTPLQISISPRGIINQVGEIIQINPGEVQLTVLYNTQKGTLELKPLEQQFKQLEQSAGYKRLQETIAEFNGVQKPLF